MTIEPAIEARGLEKRFDATRAVDGVDLRIAAGEVRGLLGPNGAGKTTLLRMLFGLIRPDAGTIALLGTAIDGSDASMPRGVSGFVETPTFYPYLSGRRNLELLADLDGGVPRSRIGEVLDTVVLSDAGGRKVGAYSSGMRQRLGLAASLLRLPRLLLLDEPTLGLDPVGARDVRMLLRGLANDGVTVLLSSHNVAEVEDLCDDVTIMRSGKAVWDGTLERLRVEAPAPAHVLSTNDDARALALAGTEPDVEVIANPKGGLTVLAETSALDGFAVALGRAGIAIRRLELLMSPLESMFFELTGAPGPLDDAEAAPTAASARVAP